MPDTTVVPTLSDIVQKRDSALQEAEKLLRGLAVSSQLKTQSARVLLGHAVYDETR